jgi:hypothetical protein
MIHDRAVTLRPVLMEGHSEDFVDCRYRRLAKVKLTDHILGSSSSLALRPYRTPGRLPHKNV